MNLLLTGATGFVGQYFISKYSKKYTIKTFSFLKDDIKKLDCSGINTVFHLSALVHQMGGASAEDYEQINVVQTVDLAQKAKASGVKHFIFMSTVKVYGEETLHKYTENSLCNPEDEYGKSKLKAENELRRLETDSFKVSIVRTPIVYGYGVKANIKNLVLLVRKFSILPLGKINNKRSLVYIGNLCHLVDTLIAQERSGVFLASDNEPVSTTQLIRLISTSLNKNMTLVKVPLFECCLRFLKPSFHKRLYGSLEVDNSDTKTKLNLSNPYHTEDGIRAMLMGESFL